MKKILLTIFALATVGANAQFAPGSTAPDFTATDIYGNSHSLYADYLNEGKHVILNVSATWCGPCWNYHNTHALGDFYEAYGPNGSNEAVVLYVEGDPSTTLNDIYGTGNNTWGDWTAGTPYPIIDSGSVANLYHAPYVQPYFPTVFRICSSGIITEINQLSALNLKNNINNNCGTLTGVPNHAKVTLTNNTIYSCSSSITSSLSASLKNFGNNNITSAVLVVKENGNVIATENFSGNVAQYSSGTISFSSVSFNVGNTYEVEVQSINNETIYNADLGVTQINVVGAEAIASTDLEVRVYTDNYPSEISWKIKNSSGTVVAQGGPYQAGNADEWGGGGPDANTTKIHNITIPASYDCYSIELSDAYNDGWIYNSAGAPVSGLEIFENGNSITFVDANFQFTTNVKQAAFKYDEAASTPDIATTNFSVYPNPSTGIFNISTSEVVKVNIVDISGKVVYKADALDNNSTINLSSLQAGIYLMNVSGENINKTEKLIIK